MDLHCRPVQFQTFYPSGPAVQLHPKTFLSRWSSWDIRNYHLFWNNQRHATGISYPLFYRTNNNFHSLKTFLEESKFFSEPGLCILYTLIFLIYKPSKNISISTYFSTFHFDVSHPTALTVLKSEKLLNNGKETEFDFNKLKRNIGDDFRSSILYTVLFKCCLLSNVTYFLWFSIFTLSKLDT